jgi:ATP-dependent Clp protease ATP-binding subunit ClpA
MFERFSDDARAVVVLAQEEAHQLRHDYIGTEHLLLGLLRDQGPVGEVLGSLGIFVDAAREEVVRLVGDRPVHGARSIPFTPRAKKVLELAVRESLHLRNERVEPGHLLLGIVDENEGVAMAVLEQFRLDGQSVREALGARISPADERWERRSGPVSSRLLRRGPRRAARVVEERESRLLKERVATELEGLTTYAEAVAEQHRRDRSRSIATERAYISGSLTTLFHLGLISQEEHALWMEKLLEMSPPDEATGRFTQTD